MMSNSLYVLTCLCLLVVVSEWLVRRTWLRHFGTALLVILLTAVAANLGILPAGSSEEVPVAAYEGIFAYLAPISIFWLLLGVNLRDILRTGLPIMTLYLIGSAGTVVGVLTGMMLINGATTIGEFYQPIGGMFVGTYTGGSVNFNALALHYEIMREGVLYGGSIAVDNIITAFWMVATLGMPKLLKRFWPASTVEIHPVRQQASLGIEEDTESLHPIDLGITLALGMGALLLSQTLSTWMGIPSIIVLTIIALVIAQLPWARMIKGAQVLGMFSVYLFLATIGAFCNLEALGQLGWLGLYLFLFALVIVGIHGLFTVVAARILKLDPALAAVASQANIGGATSALALARSLGRNDLVLPAVLLGSLGLALGTFLGFLTTEQLLPMLMK